MGRRTDTRERIIAASLDQMRVKGFASTAISDIVAASGAPRGSVTFHFPGGKEEIAREAIRLRTAQVLEGVADVAANSTTTADFLGRAMDRVIEDFADSGFVAGCPVVPTALDRGTQSDDLRQASRSFFSGWKDALARGLVERGMDDTGADKLAWLTVTAVEGALVVARVERSSHVLHAVREQVVAAAEN